VRARIPLKPAAEITLEANPGTVDRERFSGFRQAGINRLSMGIQSFQDDMLCAIGRIHNAQDAISAVEAARSAGFDNFNLDLMFGLPGQTVTQALADLQQAIQLEPAHLSWYELTIEPNTWFHRHPPERPADDTLLMMQAQGQALLGDAGYQHYQVSAVARPGRQCRHNLNYWQFGDYLGIGAGAHGKITRAGEGRIHRTWRKRHPEEYMRLAGSAGGIDGQRELNAAEVLFEFALNRFRLKAPFELAEFESVCGLQRSRIIPLLQQLQSEGLVTLEGERVRATDRGWLFLNEVLERFLPEEAPDARSRMD